MKCNNCKIYTEMPEGACCAWYMDNVVCGDKTAEDCPKQIPCSDKEPHAPEPPSMKQCEHYCGVACVDGSCPVASRDEYAERGYDTIDDCKDCWRYKGCEDCAFDGTDICPEHHLPVK